MTINIGEHAALQSGVKAIPLTFPSHWTSHTHLHPDAADISAAVIDWLVAGGVISENDSLYQVAREIRPGEFVGYSFPDASYDRAVDIGKLWTTELLWDEIDVETGGETQSISKQAIFDLFRLKKDFDFDSLFPGAPDRLIRLLRLMREILVTMHAKHGDDFIRHNAEEMYIWYKAAKREQVMAEEFQQGRAIFTAEEFFTNRCITVGSTLGMNIEYAYNYHMPPCFHKEAHIVELKDLAAALVALGNDVCSLGKDQRGNWPSSISVRMAFDGQTLDRALERIVSEYGDYCRAFDEKAARILQDSAFVEKYPLAKRFIEHMRLYTSGLPLWETAAERYTNIRLELDGSMYVPTVKFAGEPTVATIGPPRAVRGPGSKHRPDRRAIRTFGKRHSQPCGRGKPAWSA
jgi:hypothetical protein